MQKVVTLLFIISLCSVNTEAKSEEAKENGASPYFFPGFPFPPGINFPPSIPNLRPPQPRSRPRPDSRPSNRERCPAEGVKLISHTSNCEKYILCVDGSQITELQCSNGLHFSRHTRSCVDARAAGCDESYKWACPEIHDPKNIVFLPNKKDCSAYFLCWEGTKISMTCQHLHWSIYENSCRDPQEANCMFPFKSINSEQISSANFSTSIKAANQAKSYVSCPSTGIITIPSPNSCEEFYICIHGTPMLRECQTGLHFSPTHRNCAPPEVANCIINNCPPTGLKFLPHDEDCTQYHICFNGVKTTTTCPNDLHWSVDASNCMEPHEAGCEDYDEPIECPPTGIEQIPYPNDCEKYILCVNGLDIPLSCASGLHFSPTLRNCAPPEIARCEEKNEWKCPATDTPGVIVFIPNTEDCNSYYLCWQGSQIPLACPRGEHWSKVENRCLAPHLANCPWADDDEPEECPLEGIIPISHPKSCDKYILCVNGHEVERMCPSGFHFSREIRNCVHPLTANCIQPAKFSAPADGSFCPSLESEHDMVFMPNKNDCGSYYLCLKNESKLFSCSKEARFDVNKKKCLLTEKAECFKE